MENDEEIKDVVEPLPYTEPSKELQELFKFIDDAMKEVVQGMYSDLPPLGDSRRTTQLKLETYERMNQDAKAYERMKQDAKEGHWLDDYKQLPPIPDKE